MRSLSKNAITVLESRYLIKNDEGSIVELPETLFRRVAKHIASVENDKEFWEDRFFELMSNLLFMPNSPTLMNAGAPLGQLSACFVLPVEDSIESIFETLKHTAMIQKSGGGTGFNFSAIRPLNDHVSTTSGEASGPLSFMRIYDAATENIKQGGKRRGANMGILNISHPDIEHFIASKAEDRELTNFNISVGMTDEFMRAVEEDKEFRLVHPHLSGISKWIKAKQLWEQIVRSAWKTGDPGLVFLDTINETNPTPALGKIECTNPCGEVPLLSYEPCNLGSINLSWMIKDKEVDWNLLEETVKDSIRFLDNVIEVNNYILPQIEQMAKGNRKIGLGVMGWADLLVQLEIPYASEDAIQLGEKLMCFINETSFKASEQLALERGNFKNWEKSIYYPDKPMRNATRTSIAPTGTISVIADCSSSIEPYFALAFRRENVLKNQTLSEVNEYLKIYLNDKGLLSDEVMNILESTGSIEKVNSLSLAIRTLFQTSHEISWEWHLKHQIAFQKYTDNAVSKTINLPNTASVDDISKAYITAWKMKAKGITVFRDGSKTKQVLNLGVHSSCEVCAD